MNGRSSRPDRHCTTQRSPWCRHTGSTASRSSRSAPTPTSPPRTFFNYFSSKAHAALGLDSVEVPERAAARFVEADGALVDDLCTLVAATVPLSQDRRRMKELLVLRPEMSAMVMRWMAESRQSLLSVVGTRTDAQTARTAVTLVMSALSEAAHRETVRSNDELADRLRSVVREMAALVS
ncbi:TetR family transcriptional regulator [Curtobacterium flaccumfaciens]|uniref:TetR family transcriptional regulator n=1 Tax=Curtobacterium flaccumfaciens TaxID=2035 RepID=UPI0021C98ADA|nr:TetR family transcriptional regulator [Curtobacterium flaccumfaciens]